MRRNAYGGYRGRRTGRDMLKLLVALLLILAVVLAGIIFLGRDQLVSSASSEKQQASETSQGEAASPLPEPEPIPEPEPVTEPEPAGMMMVGVSAEQLLDGSWSRQLEQEGANGIVVNMKPDDAPLRWVSGQEMAAAAGANRDMENVNERLRDVLAGEVYAVARMSCFRDDLLAATKDYCIRSNSDYRWKDFGGVYWTSATVPAVQDYLVALAVELAELGFDEILLDHCGYPQDGSGEMGWIKRGAAYDLEHLDVVVGQFLDKLTRALEPYEAVVSIRTNATVLEAGGAKTGLTGALLDQYADRVWMSGEGLAVSAADVLSLAGVSSAEERLILEVSELTGRGETASAMMDF